MQIDYLKSEDARVHAIHCEIDGDEITIGILCLIAFPEATCRIFNENHSVTIDLPKSFCSGSKRVKVFNATLAVLNHEQI
jgi:hypothetical protein